MRRLRNCQFGATTFVGRTCENDKIGSHGLPVTPASVQILGRFQFILALDHPHLCKYLDLCRTQTERVILISEHYPLSLRDLLIRGQRFNEHDLLSIFTQIIDVFYYLHKKGITVGYFDSTTVLVTRENPMTIRLSQYALHYSTDYGANVDFLIGFPWYLSPERLVRISDQRLVTGPKADIWALGILLLELSLGVQLSSVWGLKQIFGVLRSVIRKGKNGSAFEGILDALKMAKSSNLDEIFCSIKDLIRKCLSILPSKRPNSTTLFAEMRTEITSTYIHFDFNGVFKYPFGMKRTLGDITHFNEPFCIFPTDHENNDRIWLTDPLQNRPIDQVYYLWKLCGSSVETILTKNGVIKPRPPINTLPIVLIGECEMFGNEKSRFSLTDLSITPLCLKNLKDRIAHLDPERFLLSLKYREKEMAGSNLTTIVKERDIEYQLFRMLLFERLLLSYPHTFDEIRLESAHDIPPLYRGFIWAALLGVKGDVHMVYDTIDTITSTATDRQIEVDIPRCHQYDELLSSSTARTKLKRLVKAWLNTHPLYVYWQGFDSLCAPFLRLHFNNEGHCPSLTLLDRVHSALAYACLKHFVSRYLHNFFLKDNSTVIQEYLSVFNHLLSFLDPHLCVHLRDIDFTPSLYAIPWFLTMFAHVLPLHKLFHLWDAMLLHDGAFPLFFGVAILIELRDLLLSYGFNECILLFSDFPDINVEKCVIESKKLYSITPRSCTFLQHTPSENSDEYVESMTEFSHYDLGTYSCPRISASDLASLINRHDILQNPPRLSSVFLIDVRSQEEFNQGSIPNSINVVYLDGHFRLPEIPYYSLVCIVGDSTMNQAKILARKLVESGCFGVCILDKGVDALKYTNLLTVKV